MFGEFEFDVVMDVFGLWVGGDDGLVERQGFNGAQALNHAREFVAGEDVGRFDRAGVGDAGFDLEGKKTPVEGEGALPFFELLVEWFAEAAGPHFCGLFFVFHLRLVSSGKSFF